MVTRTGSFAALGLVLVEAPMGVGVTVEGRSAAS
jgi:hypothetical protein